MITNVFRRVLEDLAVFLVKLAIALVVAVFLGRMAIKSVEKDFGMAQPAISHVQKQAQKLGGF